MLLCNEFKVENVVWFIASLKKIAKDALSMSIVFDRAILVELVNGDDALISAVVVFKITAGFDNVCKFDAVWVGNVVEVDDEREIEDVVREEEAEGFEERRLLEGGYDGEKEGNWLVLIVGIDDRIIDGFIDGLKDKYSAILFNVLLKNCDMLALMVISDGAVVELANIDTLLDMVVFEGKSSTWLSWVDIGRFDTASDGNIVEEDNKVDREDDVGSEDGWPEGI